MSTDYTYDEAGQFFPYFILTITGLITLPLTYSTFKRGKELENTAPRIHSDFKPSDAELIQEQKRKQKRLERKMKRMVFSGLGWLVMLYMVYLMAVTARHIPKLWDPYEVLGVSMSATEPEIKRHYRRLSLTQHPDKVKIDAAKNETIESVNEHWVEITKAFKALTDEEVRNNYLQFGHPDGKQSFSMGIALPKWLVADGYGKYTLIFYLGLLGIILPYLVGKWWYGTQKITKDGILVNSAGNLVREYRDEMTIGDVMTTLSCGDEFDALIDNDRKTTGLANIEKRINAEGALSQFSGGLSFLDQKKLQDLSSTARRKVLGLLWAYLGRVDLGDEALNKEKFAVPPAAWKLNEVLSIISLPFQHLKPLVSALHASQHIIQAIPPGGSPLLQLPYFTPEVVLSVEGGATRKHLTIQEYMVIPSDQRKKLTVGPKLLTEAQYQTAMVTAAQLPVIKIEKAFFKVHGERNIIPNSLVQLVLKLRFLSPGAKDVPPVDESILKEMPDEDENEDQERFPAPLAHAPFFARDHSPVWSIFLGDGKMGRIAVPPFQYSTFDQPVVNSDGDLTGNVQTIKSQFGAPPQAGKYTFLMHVICDSYLGFDVKEYVTLDVEEASRADDTEDEGEISEPGEDSIAGQMKALRSGAAAPAPVDSDESDTEGDIDDDSSDTNTDTDEE